MKKKLLPLLIFLVTMSTTGYAQVIFSETFDGVGGPTAGGAGTLTFPAGWLLRNVDNRTPDAQVAYVNEAWERREDFNFNVADSVAFSTSYYAPAGAADDWMWTPLIPIIANCELSWNAVTYDASFPDGYEVRIMTAAQGPPTGGTGAIGNQVTNSTVLFTTPAENTTWTNRSISLAAYAGQSVYIAFRNNSNDKFLLLIDDVVVQVLVNDDVALDSLASREYTFTPLAQVPAAGIPLGARVLNDGLSAATDVSLSISVYNSNNVLVHSGNSGNTPLASGATANLSIASFVPTVADDYMIVYNVTMSATDQVPANNVDTQYISITNSLYARDNGNVAGSLGIGAGNGGYLGQDFMIETAASLSSVGVFYTRGYTGRRYAVAVWDMAAGQPNTIVATTDTLIYPDDSARYYILPMSGGPFNLAPGRYAFTAIEFDSTLAVGLATEIFTAGRTWVDWPTSPITGWANNEDFGAAFQRAYVIRPTLCASMTSNVTFNNIVCQTSGSASVSITGADAPYDYTWSTGATTNAVTSLPAGSHTLTVTDAMGCSVSASVSIADSSVTVTADVTTTQSTCNSADGSATVTPTNGTAAYNYDWSNGDSTATISNLAFGNYTVTITDANGCTGTAAASITNPNGPSATTSTTDVLCHGALTGAVTLTATGGTSPLTYIWSNGASTQNLNGVAAGSYSVTITDANSCAFSLSAVVNQPPALVLTGVVTDATSGNNGAVNLTATGGAGSYAYDWSNGATTEDVSGLGAGTYTVTVTDANNCTSSSSFTIIPVGIQDDRQITALQLFPNPASHTAHLQVTLKNADNLRIELVDVTGKILWEQQTGHVTTYHGTLNLSAYATGIYLVRVSGAHTQSVTRLCID